MAKRHLAALALSASALTLASASPALADPIFTPLFTSLFAPFLTGSVTIAGQAVATATIAASLASGLLTAAIGIGLNLLLSPNKAPKPENGLSTVQQTTPARIYGYGRWRGAGAMMLAEESGGNFYFVAALVSHRIHRFVGLYLNDDRVELSATSGGPPLPDMPQDGAAMFVSPGDDDRYDARVKLAFRRGLATEVAYSEIVAALPTHWTTNHRGDGTASLALICDKTKPAAFTKTYPYGRCQPSAVMDTALVFDPRDPTQSATNPETWKYSDNPALCILHQRCFNEFGAQRLYAKAIAPVLDTWIEEANRCDDLVLRKGGSTEARFRIGGWSNTESDSKTTLKAMLDACDGWHIVRGDGTEILDIGLYREPEVTITDADILGFELQVGVAGESNANRFNASFTSPDHHYTTQQVSAFDWTEDQVRRGKVSPTTVELPWVQSDGQASRVLKRAVIRAKEKRRGVLHMRLSGLNACYTRRIRVISNSIPGFSNVVVENRKPMISIASGRCSIEVVVSGPEIDDYDPETDQRAVPPVPQRPANIGLPIPTNVDVVVTLIGGAASLAVTFDTPLVTGGGASDYDTSLDYVVRWRLQDAGSGDPGEWTEAPINDVVPTTARTTVTVGVVLAETILEVEVAATSGARRSPFSATETVDTHSTAPSVPAPSGLTATLASGDVTLECTNPNAANFAGVQFWSAATAGDFSTATTVGPVLYGAANGTTTYVYASAPTGRKYYATAINTAGAHSTPAGPVTP